MNKLSIILLLLAITKYATADSAIPTTTDVLDASNSEPCEDNETMMDRGLKKERKKSSSQIIRFRNRKPVSLAIIDVPYVVISVRVIDEYYGIKKVIIETKHQNENTYVSHGTFRQRGSSKYTLNLLNLQEGVYTWRVRAVNNDNFKKRSTTKSFVVSFPVCIIASPTAPSQEPSTQPSVSSAPSQESPGGPSSVPSQAPGTQSSTSPSQEPNTQPSVSSAAPSQEPSTQPPGGPGGDDSQEPSTQPSTSTNPSSAPSQEPSAQPSTSIAPSQTPTTAPATP
jgi:hypothetical protein